MNTLLILFFIQSVINFILLKRGKRPNVLSCGLWCYSGTEPADPWKMRVLALYNMARGDHATGLCIDDEVVKEVTSAKDFLASNPELFDFKELSKKNFTVLGHCRQASGQYAKDNKDFAHPHAIKKADTDKKPFLFLVHNGTVTNLWDLCHKYEIDSDYNKYSDSIQLARIITKNWEAKNMEVLKDYEGSATLVFYPITAKNTIYVHRDKMRELYYWNETHNKVYVSSVKEALKAIGAPADDIKEFKPGLLIKFTNGHITKEWDFSNKVPYSKPKSNTRANRALPPAIGNGAGYTKSTKEGFYWDNHLVYHNGHAYTGSFYLENNGRRVELVDSGNFNKGAFTKHYALMGIVTKDQKAYIDLFTLCSTSNKLDFQKFKKLTPGILSTFSMYPVLGKIYTNNNQQVFWSPEFSKLTEADAKYEWTPLLSNQKMIANRAGFLQLVQKLGGKERDSSEMSSMECVQHLIDKKIKDDESYNNIADLYEDYRKFRNLTIVANTFDLFLDAAVLAIHSYGKVAKSDIDTIAHARYVEDYGSQSMGVTDSNEILTLVSEALLDTCRQLLLESKVKTDEEFNSYELIEEERSEDAEYFNSSYFRDSFLFGNYESLDDAIINLVPSDETMYIRDFLLGLNNVFLEIGLITSIEHAENLACSKRNLDTMKTHLRLSFEVLNEEGFYKDLMDGFIGTEVDLVKNVNDIYLNITAIEYQLSPNFKGRTEEEQTKLKIYKLALSYIIDRSKTLDIERLEKDYKIKKTDLEEICKI